jgi:electron transfer flavoprotein beta subunit
MEILVCVKRVPTVGGAITLTADGQAVDTRMSGFTISPHEECAVEEAVRIVERHDGVRGSVTVVTLGPAEAEEQLRFCLSLGASQAILVETDGSEIGPIVTASALASVALQGGYDLVLLGNEASDTGGYQVGIRMSHFMHYPVVTGIKSLSVSVEGTSDSGWAVGSVEARREYRGVTETFRLPLPAIVTVKEGINLPRYPSLPGRLRAKRAVIERIPLASRLDEPPESYTPRELRVTGLRVPTAARRSAVVLGSGVAAVPELVRVLEELGVLS